MARRWRNGCIGIISALFMAALWPKIIFAAAEDAYKDQQAGTERVDTAAGWDEEYTDTDTRTGTLLVRCQTFQGFHGTVELIIKNIAGGWERCITLTGEGDYALSLPLPAETYQIVGVEAWTGGRRYECRIHQAEFIISAEQSTLFQVSVSPDSVYRLPEEEDMTAESTGLEPGEPDEPDEAAGGPPGAVNEPVPEDRQLVHPDTDAGNQEAAQPAGDSRGFILAGGTLGLAVCLGSIFYTAGKNKK